MKDGKIEKSAMRLIIQHSKFQIRNSNLAPSLQGRAGGEVAISKFFSYLCTKF
jgi:hypothetical protein